MQQPSNGFTDTGQPFRFCFKVGNSRHGYVKCLTVLTYKPQPVNQEHDPILLTGVLTLEGPSGCKTASLLTGSPRAELAWGNRGNPHPGLSRWREEKAERASWEGERRCGVRRHLFASESHGVRILARSSVIAQSWLQLSKDKLRKIFFRLSYFERAPGSPWASPWHVCNTLSTQTWCSPPPTPSLPCLGSRLSFPLPPRW